MSELREALTTTRKTVTKEQPETIHYDFAGKKILLVEDNPLNLEIATEILQEAGFIVDTANDGDVAIEKLDNPFAANLPIIAMTANAFEEDKKKSFEAGMNGHLSKPIEIEKLMEVLNVNL